MGNIRIGINGFGRIGRTLFRLLEKHPSIQVVAINDLADAKTLAHLLKYDSIHGIFEADVQSEGNSLIVNGREIKVLNQNHPKDINWRDQHVEFVVESTGKFKKRSNWSIIYRMGPKK